MNIAVFVDDVTAANGPLPSCREAIKLECWRRVTIRRPPVIHCGLSTETPCPNLPTRVGVSLQPGQLEVCWFSHRCSYTQVRPTSARCREPSSTSRYVMWITIFANLSVPSSSHIATSRRSHRWQTTASRRSRGGRRCRIGVRLNHYSKTNSTEHARCSYTVATVALNPTSRFASAS